MAFVTARIPMQHIEALCNVGTDGNNSLHSSLSLTTFPPPSPFPPLSRLLCPQWQLWWYYCCQQHDTFDAVAVSLHPGQQVVWVSNPLRKPDWFWEGILLASFFAWCLYFLFLLQCLSLELFLSSNLQDGETALHVACHTGHDSVVKLLIDAHADLGTVKKVRITKPMAFVTARIPMRHKEALCTACTDRYASYSNNSLPSSFSITTFPPPSPPLCHLLCPQWQLWWHYCWQQHDTSDAVAVSLHPSQQVVWVSNPLRKPEWLWERILLASFYAECLYFLFLITVCEFGILFVL